MAKVLFANSGSEANDTAVKLVWYINNALGRPQKKKIISRQRAYHGVTIASASLTGLAFAHTDFDLPIARILHTDCPHHYRGARAGESEEAFAARLADSPRAADPARGSGHRRGVLRRAGDGRGRRDRPAGDLLRPDPADPEEIRHPVRRRRSHLRLRAHRQHVRVADVQPRARHHDAGEGAVGGVPADLGEPRVRQALRHPARRKATSSASSATATPIRRTRCRRPSRSKRSRSTRSATSWRRCAASVRGCRRASAATPTTR